MSATATTSSDASSDSDSAVSVCADDYQQETGIFVPPSRQPPPRKGPKSARAQVLKKEKVVRQSTRFIDKKEEGESLCRAEAPSNEEQIAAVAKRLNRSIRETVNAMWQCCDDDDMSTTTPRLSIVLIYHSSPIDELPDLIDADSPVTLVKSELSTPVASILQQLVKQLFEVDTLALRARPFAEIGRAIHDGKSRTKKKKKQQPALLWLLNGVEHHCATLNHLLSVVAHSKCDEAYPIVLLVPYRNGAFAHRLDRRSLCRLRIPIVIVPSSDEVGSAS